MCRVPDLRSDGRARRTGLFGSDVPCALYEVSDSTDDASWQRAPSWRTAPHRTATMHTRLSSPVVLVTDGFLRTALSATRSLGSAGFRVMVSERSVINPARYSRYASRALRCPTQQDATRYIAWLRSTVREHGIDAVLPINDISTSAVVHNEIPGAVALVPTPEQFQVCRDKLLTVGLASQACVPVPMAVGVATLPEAREALARIGTPAVLKLRESSGGRGIAFLDNSEDLDRAWPLFAGQSVYIQQRVPSGRKFDVCLLYDAQGDLQRRFVQEEVRWYPTQSSVSTVQRSADRPDLVELACRTLEPIGWRGVVELEYMEDAAGTPWLLEINPRLWSSVELAVQCGIDFATLSVDLALGREIPQDPGYPADVYCTWTLPGEFLRRMACFFRGDKEGSKRACPPGSPDNIISSRDPLPVLGVQLTVARHILDISLWRHLFQRP